MLLFYWSGSVFLGRPLYHWDAEEVSISFLSECICLKKFIKIGIGIAVSNF